MAGRTAILSLLPLSIKELGDRAKDISTDTLILNGGYPAVWANNVPREMLYSNYYSTYVERDARVDVIQLIGIHIYAYEIKSGKSFKSDFFKNIDYLKSLIGDKITRSAVIYDGDIESDYQERGIYNFRNINP
jgi:hypothetical protein